LTTDPSQCVPGYQTLDANGRCPESIGLLQVRYPYHQTAFQSDDDAAVSSAYNLDYAYASWRNCFEGNDGWLNQFNPPQPYRAGDMWGCRVCSTRGGGTTLERSTTSPRCRAI
jgi:autotransporter family porin